MNDERAYYCTPLPHRLIGRLSGSGREPGRTEEVNERKRLYRPEAQYRGR